MNEIFLKPSSTIRKWLIRLLVATAVHIVSPTGLDP